MMVEVIPLVCRMWRDALERTQGVNRREWLSELAAIDREFTEWPDGREPVRRRPRRVAQAPDVPAPFFAGRSGALPPTGSATVAGVRLPKGTRRPSVAPAYWISDEAVDDAASLAGWLAGEFSGTGLSPLLWLYDEDPDVYMEQPGNPDRIDGISVEDFLQERWRSVVESAPEASAQIGSIPPVLARGEAHAPGRHRATVFACTAVDAGTVAAGALQPPRRRDHRNWRLGLRDEPCGHLHLTMGGHRHPSQKPSRSERPP